jgi:hypothetical protein
MTRRNRTGAAHAAAALAVLAMVACTGSKTSSSTGTSGGSGSSGSSSGGSSGGSSGSGTYTTVCEQLSQSVTSYLNTCEFASATEQSALLIELNQACGATEGLITAQMVQYNPANASQCAGYLDIPTYGCQGNALLAATACEQALISGIVPVNGACQSTRDCALLADAGSVACLPTPGGQSCGGTCTLPPGLGEPCSYSCPLGNVCLACSSGSCPSPTAKLADGGALPEVCTAPVALGDTCAEGSLGCVAGAYCDTTHNPATCVTQIAAGASCPLGYGSSCVSGFFCGSPSDGGSDGSCSPQGALGADCSDLPNDFCMTPLSCAGGSSGPALCSPESATVGQPCTAETDCTSADGSQAICSITSGNVGICAPLSAGSGAVHLGAACTGGNGTFCDPGLLSLVACVNGTCAAPGIVGASCSNSVPCQLGLACVNGTCAAPLVVGQGTCTVGDTGAASCSTGYCNPSNHVCTAFLDAGSTCVPSALDCSGYERSETYGDGGSSAVDVYCIAPGDGGADHCVRNCE